MAFAPLAAQLAQPLVKYLAITIVLILVIGGAYAKGRSDMAAIMQSTINAQQVEILENNIKWTSRIDQAEKANQKKLDEIVGIYHAQKHLLESQIDQLKSQEPKVVTKTVRVYVPSTVDTVLPNGFVMIHNKASQGQSLETSPIPSAAQSSDVSLSEAASVIAQNYYRCNHTRQQLIALQEVVRSFQQQQEALSE